MDIDDYDEDVYDDINNITALISVIKTQFKLTSFEKLYF